MAKNLKKFHRPLPVIPGIIYPYPRKAYFIAFGALGAPLLFLLILSPDYETFFCTFMAGVVILLLMLRDFLKHPPVRLNKSDFITVHHKDKKSLQGSYEDYVLFIEKIQVQATTKNYTYKLSLLAKSGFTKVVLYPSILMPENLREIVERINTSVSPTMHIAFSEEQMKHDYETAFDI